MSFKSFLNWIQSDEADPKRTDQSKINWNEKRRDNRVDLPPEKNLTAHLMSQDEGSDVAKTLVASVRNVSVRGCGLFFESAQDRDRLKVKQILLASLAVDDFPIPLQVEVVRLVGKNEVAVRFKPPFPRELEKLERFLEPRCLGRSLREIDSSKLQGTQAKGFRWFQGVNETHLFTWVNLENGNIAQQQLVFLDRVVEWKDNGSIRTGSIRSDEKAVSGDVGWVKAELMDFDPKSDPMILQQAKILIESAPIEEAVKQTFLKKLSN